MAGENPLVLDPRVIRPASRQGQRVTRSPSTPFGLIWKPWQLQPCACFPVFPGETLTTMQLQMQFWSDPLKAAYKNTPWTFEYASFYVPFVSMPGWSDGTGIGADLITMMEAGTKITAVDADGDLPTYTAPGGANFVLAALQTVTERFFREDGQAWDESTTDGLPNVSAFAGLRRDVNWKLTDTTDVITAGKIATPSHLGSAFTEAYQDLAAMKEVQDDLNSIMEMDYSDVVRASGGRTKVDDSKREDLHRPELLAHTRHFDYPVNTVEPSTGVPAVAFGHRLRQRMAKAFRFGEFGFVLCVVFVRPKVFWKNQAGSFLSMMLDRTNWMYPSQDQRTSQGWLSLGNAVGPYKALFDTGNIDYSVDLRDLFKSGEQFLNYAPDAAKDSVVTLPEVGFDRDYPASGDILAGFSDTTNGRFRANGVVDCTFRTWPAIVGAGQPTATRLMNDWV